MPDNLPQRRPDGPWTDVASFSKEATAEFLAGGELGRPKWSDPEIQRKQDEQRAQLRQAFTRVTPILATFLHQYSPQAEASLTAHFEAAMKGDVQSYRMYCAMLAELGKQALQP